jgi:hypothetical protein
VATSDLRELKKIALEAQGPALVPFLKVKTGGVDPLGLRQTNFNLMDEVFPGVNNVGRHVRPFVVVAWAWRRALELAEKRPEREIHEGLLRDFVDRIETIYSWSQFMLNSDSSLPGGELLRPRVNLPSWRFGGDEWTKFRDTRRVSTGLTAPITYGPALKMLGWIAPFEKWRHVMCPLPEVEPALLAFEAGIAQHLSLPLFNVFGDIEVQASDVRSLAPDWALEKVTDAERKVAADLIFGVSASRARRSAGAAMLTVARHLESHDVNAVRAALAGVPSNFKPPEFEEPMAKWRQLQVRQLFRLSLEAFFFWSTKNLGSEPRSVTSLADQFLREAGDLGAMTTHAWRASLAAAGAADPVGVMNRIAASLEAPNSTDLAQIIAIGICLALQESTSDGAKERADRLPIAKARREADERSEDVPAVFVKHVLEAWIFAQHTYWSVGRGLADARAGGKTLLRLKLILEEGGWTLAPGGVAKRPIATRDRLETMLSLAAECGLLEISTRATPAS